MSPQRYNHPHLEARNGHNGYHIAEYGCNFPTSVGFNAVASTSGIEAIEGPAHIAEMDLHELKLRYQMLTADRQAFQEQSNLYLASIRKDLAQHRAQNKKLRDVLFKINVAAKLPVVKNIESPARIISDVYSDLHANQRKQDQDKKSKLNSSNNTGSASPSNAVASPSQAKNKYASDSILRGKKAEHEKQKQSILPAIVAGQKGDLKKQSPLRQMQLDDARVMTISRACSPEQLENDEHKLSVVRKKLDLLKHQAQQKVKRIQEITDSLYCHKIESQKYNSEAVSQYIKNLRAKESISKFSVTKSLANEALTQPKRNCEKSVPLGTPPPVAATAGSRFIFKRTHLESAFNIFEMPEFATTAVLPTTPRSPRKSAKNKSNESREQREVASQGPRDRSSMLSPHVEIGIGSPKEAKNSNNNAEKNPPKNNFVGLYKADQVFANSFKMFMSALVKLQHKLESETAARTLETELDNAMIRHTEAQKVGTILRKIEQELQKEKFAFDSRLKQSADVLRNRVKDRGTLEVVVSDALHARDLVRRNFWKAETVVSGERKARERTLHSRREQARTQLETSQRVETQLLSSSHQSGTQQQNGATTENFAKQTTAPNAQSLNAVLNDASPSANGTTISSGTTAATDASADLRSVTGSNSSNADRDSASNGSNDFIGELSGIEVEHFVERIKAVTGSEKLSEAVAKFASQRATKRKLSEMAEKLFSKLQEQRELRDKLLRDYAAFDAITCAELVGSEREPGAKTSTSLLRMIHVSAAGNSSEFSTSQITSSVGEERANLLRGKEQLSSVCTSITIIWLLLRGERGARVADTVVSSLDVLGSLLPSIESKASCAESMPHTKMLEECSDRINTVLETLNDTTVPVPGDPSDPSVEQDVSKLLLATPAAQFIVLLGSHNLRVWVPPGSHNGGAHDGASGNQASSQGSGDHDGAHGDQAAGGTGTGEGGAGNASGGGQGTGSAGSSEIRGGSSALSGPHGRRSAAVSHSGFADDNTTLEEEAVVPDRETMKKATMALINMHNSKLARAEGRKSGGSSLGRAHGENGRGQGRQFRMGDKRGLSKRLGGSKKNKRRDSEMSSTDSLS